MTIYYSESAKLFSHTTSNLPPDAMVIPPALFQLLGLSEPEIEEPVAEPVTEAIEDEPAEERVLPPEITFWSPSTHGFYSSRIHVNLPEDVVVVTEDERLALIEGQASGKNIRPGADGKPTLVDRVPDTIEEVLEWYRHRIQGLIDDTARGRGYDSGVSCVSYLNSSIAVWKAEATAFNSWRDAVWGQVFATLSAVQSGEAKQPTLDDLLASLPQMIWE